MNDARFRHAGCHIVCATLTRQMGAKRYTRMHGRTNQPRQAGQGWRWAPWGLCEHACEREVCHQGSVLIKPISHPLITIIIAVHFLICRPLVQYNRLNLGCLACVPAVLMGFFLK